jgi:histidine triad (HIT) family protein
VHPRQGDHKDRPAGDAQTYLDVHAPKSVEERRFKAPMSDDIRQDCVFCKIIRGELPAYIVFEDDVSMAFLDTKPVFPGHTLLVPREHYETLIDLPGPLVDPLFKNAQLLAHAMEEGLKADGTFVAINNRISQSAPHLHVHIVPRHKGDGLKGFFWPRQRYKDQEEILSIQNTLRSSIDRLKSE